MQNNKYHQRRLKSVRISKTSSQAQTLTDAVLMNNNSEVEFDPAVMPREKTTNQKNFSVNRIMMDKKYNPNETFAAIQKAVNQTNLIGDNFYFSMPTENAEMSNPDKEGEQ